MRFSKPYIRLKRNSEYFLPDSQKDLPIFILNSKFIRVPIINNLKLGAKDFGTDFYLKILFASKIYMINFLQIPPMDSQLPIYQSNCYKQHKQNYNYLFNCLLL